MQRNISPVTSPSHFTDWRISKRWMAHFCYQPFLCYAVFPDLFLATHGKGNVYFKRLATL